MRLFLLTALALISASLLFGQLESDTVTIQASRSVNLTPDQAAFYVSVTADPTTSLDQIVAALSGVGITASNFSSVYGGIGNQSSLQWSFTLATPFSKMKTTIASLTALQRSIGQNNSGRTLEFQVQGTQVSAQAIQSQASAVKDLVADAQAQAQNLAAAAGLAIGPVVSISDGNSLAGTTSYAVYAGTTIPNERLSLSSFLLWYTTSPPGCYLEVKFKLLRYQ